VGLSEASVNLRGVSKAFGDVVAVRDVDLEIRRGEFFTFLGPSGCGKTTTLRMVAGFEEPTAGAIEIDGADVSGLPPHKRPTNTVFQSYALFPHMSVAENVAFGLERKRVGKQEIAARVESELERVGLTSQANRRPSQLSGGMQQRVALARALVNLPKVLLLDEPLGALDLKLRKGLQIELKRIQRDVGITFVYVTHDQAEAMSLGHRVGVLRDGALEQVGTPDEVYERPANLFVAQFVGTPPMNTLPGTVTTAGGPAVLVGESRFPVPAGLATRLEEGRPVVVGVRPEHLRVAAGGPIAAKVRAVEWLGHERLVAATVGDAPLVLRQPGTGPEASGAEVALDVDPGLVHLFDTDTTTRLP
jgi:spermidine/putrescine transport system ATP-binding protein